MIVLGAYTFTTLEQRALVDGATLDLSRGRMQPRILRMLQVGDLFWVKEPWVLLSPRRGAPSFIREAVPGPITSFVYPAHVRKWRANLRFQPMDALTLEQRDSRATLEIIGIDDTKVQVHVHMQCVVDYMKARAA